MITETLVPFQDAIKNFITQITQNTSVSGGKTKRYKKVIRTLRKTKIGGVNVDLTEFTKWCLTNMNKSQGRSANKTIFLKTSFNSTELQEKQRNHNYIVKVKFLIVLLLLFLLF